MHENVRPVLQAILDGMDLSRMDVLEVGAYNVNGSIADMFAGAKSYRGADVEDGPGVDIVLPDQYLWGIAGRYDLVVSANTLEHVRWPWCWACAAARALRSGGWVAVIVPFTIGLHRFPFDCWRLMPDGMQALLEWARFTDIRVGQSDAGYRDVWGVGRKV